MRRFFQWLEDWFIYYPAAPVIAAVLTIALVAAVGLFRALLFPATGCA